MKLVMLKLSQGILSVSSQYSKLRRSSSDAPQKYDEHPTPLQREIELAVTGGRGYLTLSNALDYVNQANLKLDLSFVCKHGEVPINFQPFYSCQLGNPCNEIQGLDSEPCNLSKPSRPPTIVERLRTLQQVKWDEICRRQGHLS